MKARSLSSAHPELTIWKAKQIIFLDLQIDIQVERKVSEASKWLIIYIDSINLYKFVYKLYNLYKL